jgi:hypothetical protein
MPINMGLAALLMSGAMQGEPAEKLTIGAEALTQPNGRAPLVLAQSQTREEMKKGRKKSGKKKEDMPKKL